MTDFLERFPGNRRLAPRHRIQTRLRVRVLGSTSSEHRAKSENLSRSGVFFATDLALQAGAKVELLLKMPQEITGVLTSEWLCTGHVVRVELLSSPRGALGVGVKFDCYEMSQAAQMPVRASGANALLARSAADDLRLTGDLPRRRGHA